MTKNILAATAIFLTGALPLFGQVPAPSPQQQQPQAPAQYELRGKLVFAMPNPHVEQATKIAPEFYHAFNNLGVAYMKVKRYKDAEAAYRRAKELNPKADQPLLNLAILFIDESDQHRSEGKPVFGKFLDDAMDCL